MRRCCQAVWSGGGSLKERGMSSVLGGNVETQRGRKTEEYWKWKTWG